MSKIKEKTKKVSNSKENNKLDDREEQESIIVEDDEFDILRVKDIENTDRIKATKRIKGVTRITRAIERPEKLVISRASNKYYTSKDFDPSFMQMQEQEIDYQQLRSELINYTAITDLVAEINSGKEASIYSAHLNGAPLIVKMFRLQLTSHNKAKRRRVGNPLTRASSYAETEYFFMNKAYRVGLNVPTPAMKINNIILMQFIGTDWVPAPQLRKVLLKEPELMFDEIVEQLKIMYQKAKLIHGDFSEYNILIHENKPIIIDFPQAIDMSLVGNRSENKINGNLQILQKDIQTIINYFEKQYYLQANFKEIYRYVAGFDANRERIDFTLEEIEEQIKLQKMTVPRAELRDLDVRGK
ncbi:MAG: hypothetical protein KAX09_03355 [Candidatus Heimdallarchaeota archaeon]|nr:hypothetical protein [Candidatus Heimdallarchaeota archaeon]MCK4289996.1 hypothetical protein [Candidatus Heimdallarchaeota archaeon]